MSLLRIPGASSRPLPLALLETLDRELEARVYFDFHSRNELSKRPGTAAGGAAAADDEALRDDVGRELEVSERDTFGMDVWSDAPTMDDMRD